MTGGSNGLWIAPRKRRLSQGAIQACRPARIMGLPAGALAVFIAGANALAQAPELGNTTANSPMKAIPAAVGTSGPPAPMPVVAPSSLRLFIRAIETAAISAEINARITYLPAREGDRFRKGDVIVSFDCRRIAAEHEAARAAFDSLRVTYENQARLLKYQAAGALAVSKARHDMRKAKSDADSLAVRKTMCVIHAPFDGRVAEKSANIHEIAQPNQQLLRIVNDEKVELVLMAPSAWLPRFRPGLLFDVRIDESGEMHRARIVQSSGHIDPVSQSARVIAEFLQTVRGVVPGMSGAANFQFNGNAQ